jgi:MORN repeat
VAKLKVIRRYLEKLSNGWKRNFNNAKWYIIILLIGNKYIGEYSRDKKHGIGTFYSADGS